MNTAGPPTHASKALGACPSCGQALYAKVSFCPYCGAFQTQPAVMDDIPSEDVRPAAVVREIEADAPAQAPPVSEATSPIVSRPNATWRRPAMIVAGAAVALAAIAFLLAPRTGRSPDAPPQPAPAPVVAAQTAPPGLAPVIAVGSAWRPLVLPQSGSFAVSSDQPIRLRDAERVWYVPAGEQANLGVVSPPLEARALSGTAQIEIRAAEGSTP
jgi:hypothetical protein